VGAGLEDDNGDVLDGGDGRDEFSYYGPDAVEIDLADGTTSSGATLENIEDAWGNEGNDTLVGDSQDNGLRGYLGDDVLDGAGGADSLEGEEGSDTLTGGAGDDRLHGGDGTDTAIFAGRRADYTITLHTDDAGTATHVTISDTVAGRDGADTIVLEPGGARTVELARFADGEVDVICFMPGTFIATPTGEVPVETLRRGDVVLTAAGRAAPIVWMGRQTVCRTFADPLRVLPVRIEAGALGEGLPRRDLLVSPDHALLLGGVLVQAGALVDGAAIRREADVPERWTYWHVELADHALVLAEGVPAETFVDNAERLAFDNWDEHEALYPKGRRVEEMALPRAKSRRQVPLALRRSLAERAGQASAAARSGGLERARAGR